MLWLGLAAIALLTDYLLPLSATRKIPSLDVWLGRLAQGIIQKLDRPSRTLSALRMRGLIAVGVLLALAFALGLLLNFLMILHTTALVAALVLIIPLFGQKQTLQNMIKAGQELDPKTLKPNADIHHMVRAAGANAVLNFTTKLVVRTLWWGLGGFAFLLPQILLAAFMNAAEKRRSGQPESPFFTGFSILHELSAAPAAIFAAALVALAHFFIPHTNLGVFKAFYPKETVGPISRYYPLNVIAHGLNLAFEADISSAANKQKKSDRAVHWIGPADGRAQCKASDLKKIWLLTIIAFALYLMIGFMVFSLFFLIASAA